MSIVYRILPEWWLWREAEFCLSTGEPLNMYGAELERRNGPIGGAA